MISKSVNFLKSLSWRIIATCITLLVVLFYSGHAICQEAGLDVLDHKTKNNIIYNRANLLNNWFIVS